MVFNHTTLEHIFNVQKAFKNLCLLSRDVVIVCVPFLQPYHSDYGDYWRFSPLCLKRLYLENGLAVLSLNWNSHRMSAVYVFGVGAKHPERWREFFTVPQGLDKSLWHRDQGIGYHALPNILHRLGKLPRRWFKKRRGGSGTCISDP